MKLCASMTCALTLAACADADGPGGSNVAAAHEFSVTIENVSPFTVLKTGAQRMKTTGVEGLANPGEAYEVRFTAGPGQSISFASMFTESNDWFFAPDPAGIPLYTNGVPTSGDVTGLVKLWDAGTELDQEPGVGDGTCARQVRPDEGGLDPDTRVRLVPDIVALSDTPAFLRPAVAAMLRVTLTPGTERSFTLRIENISTATTLQTSVGASAIHLSPAVWAVHRHPSALFVADTAARTVGLEALAEDGQPDAMSTALRDERGISSAISRGLFVIHDGGAPLYVLGAPDVGMGLEALAEDGDETTLLTGLHDLDDARIDSVGVFNTPLDAFEPSAAGPGQTFDLEFEAAPGQILSFATMFAASNDWFFATPDQGIELFVGDSPRGGDITSDVGLYDLGTELDEELDVGANTAVQQLAPNTGLPDRITEVREVGIDRYETPVFRHLRVTLTPIDIVMR